MLLPRQVGGYFHGIPPCLEDYRGIMGFLEGNCKGSKGLYPVGWAVDGGGMKV
jgi:hypothetical protein